MSHETNSLQAQFKGGACVSGERELIVESYSQDVKCWCFGLVMHVRNHFQSQKTQIIFCISPIYPQD